jgi:urease alpha subunit
LNLTKRLVAVKNCRSITKADLPFNDAMPKITVDPETYTVTADGRGTPLRAARRPADGPAVFLAE